MDAKQKMLEALQREHERLDRIAKDCDRFHINLISQAFPSGHWWNDGFHLRFSQPFDFALIEDVKTFMALQFPDMEKGREDRYIWHESNKAGHFIEYMYEYESITFEFRSDTAGSTCVLNIVSYEKKDVPVYEVVCKDAIS